MSANTADFMEIFLQPGEIYWGDSTTRIKTLLGSCVALCIWHPQLHVGGMCHCLVPGRPDRGYDELNARYIDEAIELFVKEIQKIGTKPNEYHAKVFGGGNMFPDIFKKNRFHIGMRNIKAIGDLVKGYGFKVKAEQTGGTVPQRIILDLWSGDVWMRKLLNRSN